jgi:YVTN family beta-propeller protein
MNITNHFNLKSQCIINQNSIDTIMNLTPGKIKSLFLTLTLLITFSMAACSDDPVSNIQEEELLSILVINEGNFADSNGSVTSYDPETGQVIQDKFQQVNGRPMAGIIQTAVRSGERLFIVTNSTDKIEVADAASIESIGTITFDNGITPGGFALADDSRGYVSDLFTNVVAVVDLENLETTGTLIEVGNNPQEMLVVGNRLIVANNGFGNDNTVSIIDTETDQVTATLETGSGPLQLFPDRFDRIWVLSNGYRAYDENWNRDPDNDIPGRIDVIELSTEQITATIETGGFPKSFSVDLDLGLGWVVNENAVQLIDLNSFEVTDESFISRDFNGIGYSQAENRLYLAQSRGFTQAGQTIIYDLEGAAVDSFQVGIAPKDFLFRVEMN